MIFIVFLFLSWVLLPTVPALSLAWRVQAVDTCVQSRELACVYTTLHTAVMISATCSKWQNFQLIRCRACVENRGQIDCVKPADSGRTRCEFHVLGVSSLFSVWVPCSGCEFHVLGVSSLFSVWVPCSQCEFLVLGLRAGVMESGPHVTQYQTYCYKKSVIHRRVY